MKEETKEKQANFRRMLDSHLKQLTEEMAQGKSERLIALLDFAGKFHQYSFYNIMMAFYQRRNISRLAGVKTWNEVGRYVRKGEHGIAIWAPMFFKKVKTEDEASEETESEVTFTRFRLVYVFDVSQTEGKELPNTRISMITGNPGTAYTALESAIQAQGIVIDYVDHLSGNAEARSHGGKIEIVNDPDPARLFKNLVHEFAHELLHHDGGERGTITLRETEAEATAYVVCRHFGVEINASDYIQLFDGNVKILSSRLERIRKTASTIIQAIEKESKIENPQIEQAA